MVNFKLHLYFPGWVGVVIIKLKANLSSNWTGLGLDLNWAWQLSLIWISGKCKVSFSRHGYLCTFLNSENTECHSRQYSQHSNSQYSTMKYSTYNFFRTFFAKISPTLNSYIFGLSYLSFRQTHSPPQRNDHIRWIRSSLGSINKVGKIRLIKSI